MTVSMVLRPTSPCCVCWASRRDIWLSGYWALSEIILLQDETPLHLFWTNFEQKWYSNWWSVLQALDECMMLLFSVLEFSGCIPPPPPFFFFFVFFFFFSLPHLFWGVSPPPPPFCYYLTSWIAISHPNLLVSVSVVLTAFNSDRFFNIHTYITEIVLGWWFVGC